MFIPGPGSEFFRFRIPDPGSKRFWIRIKKFQYFNPKNCSKLSEIWSGCSTQIPHPRSGSLFFTHPRSWIRIPGSKRHRTPDPWCQIRFRKTALKFEFQSAKLSVLILTTFFRWISNNIMGCVWTGKKIHVMLWRTVFPLEKSSVDQDIFFLNMAQKPSWDMTFCNGNQPV